MLLVAISHAALAAERLALVVGNARYTNVTPLDNTVNDATDVAVALEALGFRVMLHTDVRSRASFREILRQYREQLIADPRNVGVFFYAGHAVQVEGENYLIPVAGDIRNKPDLESEAITLGYVTAMAEDAGNDVNLFFIDACRDNPFRGFSRSVRRGLAPPESPQGALITFAASPGRTAADGNGRNSPFTSNLLAQINSHEHVLLMLQNVVKGVRADTAGEQQPWFHSSLTGDFYFNPTNAISTASSDVIEPASAGDNKHSVSTDTEKSATVPVPSPPPADDSVTRKAPDQQQESIDVAAIAPAAHGKVGLQGRWTGESRGESGPAEPLILYLQPRTSGDYRVIIASLISYGTLPALCTLANGTLHPLAADRFRLRLDQSSCRVDGVLELNGDKLSGEISIGERRASLSLSR